MRVSRVIWKTIALLFVLVPVAAFANEQQNTEKQTNRITAMAAGSGPTARLIVSATLADMLAVPRGQLVRERRAMNLNYGSLFIAHQLVNSGAKMLDIALQLQAGKNIAQIADEQKINWRSVGDAAKRLNASIEKNIYEHFLHSRADTQRALQEKYDPDTDIVKADLDVSPTDVAKTRDTFVFWRARAAQSSGEGVDPGNAAILNQGAEENKGDQRPHR